MIRLMALVTLLAMLGAAGVLVYAGVQRYRGREISRATVRLVAGLEGASGAIGFLFMPELGYVALFLAIPTFATYWLVRRGHGVAAGTLLIALGLPGAGWWGYFLVQDALNPDLVYDAVLWLWWAPEVVLIVVGALLIARGDRPVPVPPLLERAATQIRDPAAIGSAILRETAIGPIPIQTLIGIAAALVITGFGLPLAVQAGVPWPVGLLAGTVAFAVIAVELGYVTIPGGVRRAWEGYAVVGNPGMKRWVAMVGTPVPATLPAMHRWLERNPERPETRWARAEILLLTGDLVEARAVTERMPIVSEWDRFEQQSLRVYLGWVEGGDPDFDSLREQAEAVGDPDSAERLAARGEAVIADARALAASGGDWKAPLIALRDEAGPRADGLLREDLRRASYRPFLLFGLILCGVVLLISGLI
ncbi:MAG: hypothetical protein WD402_06145 [Chloroflexota bacterium]